MRCCAGLTLTCRAGWLAPPSRPRCSCGRDGGIAAVCQRLRSSGHSRCGLPDSLWSRGHSLLEPGTVDTAFGACPVAPALSSIFKGSLNLGWMGICGEPVTFASKLSTACPMQQCMGSVVGKDCIPRHTCRCRQQETCSGSTQPPGTCQVQTLSPASALYHVSTATGADFKLLCCRCSICCCCCCNNLFLGCYMATRPRRASCPRL